MLSIYDPRYYTSFAIDLTNKCNGKCVFCAREDKSCVEKLSDLTPDVFYKLFTPEYLNTMERLVINGNFGEPTLSKYFIEYLTYISKHNPKCHLWISTNGSTRNTEWWKRVADILSYHPWNVVRFCLDGIGEVNEIYRGTNYDKVIKNLESFNAAGGRSEWQFLMFDYNEHQIEEARKIAIDIGCDGFVKLVSRRYSDKFRRPKNIEVKTKTELCSTSDECVNFCTPIATKNLYLSHLGFVFPCCDFGYYYKEPKFYIHYLKSINQLNLGKSSLSDALNSPFFRYVYDNIDSLQLCQTSCKIENTNANADVMRWEKLEQKNEGVNK